MRQTVTITADVPTYDVRAALASARRKKPADDGERFDAYCALDVDVDPDDVLRDMDVEDMVPHLEDKLGDLPERLYLALARGRDGEALALARQLVQVLTGRLVP